MSEVQSISYIEDDSMQKELLPLLLSRELVLLIQLEKLSLAPMLQEESIEVELFPAHRNDCKYNQSAHACF